MGDLLTPIEAIDFALWLGNEVGRSATYDFLNDWSMGDQNEYTARIAEWRKCNKQ